MLLGCEPDARPPQLGDDGDVGLAASGTGGSMERRSSTIAAAVAHEYLNDGGAANERDAERVPSA
ncbi:hypothetical protein [Actinomyces ruminicola]|uniref:hypothetical protein n=1 Tax=Actinomyces ruminicola TaxID=332524 RepID=UPI0011C9EE62|nr:hypothetical protein [Actinomyces ruminicola]